MKKVPDNNTKSSSKFFNIDKEARKYYPNPHTNHSIIPSNQIKIFKNNGGQMKRASLIHNLRENYINLF